MRFDQTTQPNQRFLGSQRHDRITGSFSKKMMESATESALTLDAHLPLHMRAIRLIIEKPKACGVYEPVRLIHESTGFGRKEGSARL